MARRLAPALLLVLLAVAAPAQIPPRDIGGGVGRTPVIPQPSVSADLEVKKLNDEVEDLRIQAAAMHSKAEDLRDDGKDKVADKLDERADILEAQARKREYRAKQLQLSHGVYSGRVHVPDN